MPVSSDPDPLADLREVAGSGFPAEHLHFVNAVIAPDRRSALTLFILNPRSPDPYPMMGTCDYDEGAWHEIQSTELTSESGYHWDVFRKAWVSFAAGPAARHDRAPVIDFGDGTCTARVRDGWYLAAHWWPASRRSEPPMPGLTSR